MTCRLSCHALREVNGAAMENPVQINRSVSAAAAAAALPRGAALIGRGFTADVYAWGAGRVLKLFHPAVRADKAEREFRATAAVTRAGLPAPAVYDLVTVDGRHGIVMERIDGPSMFERVQARPWTLFDAARELARLHAEVHRCGGRPPPPELPPLRERLAEEIAASSAAAEVKSAALARLATLPDGVALCHGDFHPANILYPPGRGPVMLDWGRATRGDALGDVAFTSRLMRHSHVPEWAPRHMHVLLACSRRLLHRTYFRRSLALHGATPGQVHAWDPVLAAAGWWRGMG